MENELKKLAAAMRDMSDMVGDHHWQAAKAVEQVQQLREELAQRDAEVERRVQGAKLLIEDLERRDVTIAQLRARLAALESQQAASVGGERGQFEKWYCDEYCAGSEELAKSQLKTCDVGGGYLYGFTKQAFGIWSASRAALSPAGGGVVMPERKQAMRGDVLSFQSEGWNACLDEVARLNAKPVSVQDRQLAERDAVTAMIGERERKPADYASIGRSVLNENDQPQANSQEGSK